MTHKSWIRLLVSTWHHFAKETKAHETRRRMHTLLGAGLNVRCQRRHKRNKTTDNRPRKFRVHHGEKRLSGLARGWTVTRWNIKEEARSRQAELYLHVRFFLSLRPLVWVSEETRWVEECEEWRRDDSYGGRHESREAKDDEVGDVCCRGIQYCGSECPMGVVLVFHRGHYAS
jgi:hypothetical protein